MPYEHIEQIHERKGEKVALMLTAENMAGLIIGALPIYLLTASLPFWVRAITLILSATLGVMATLDMGGMTPAGRIAWMARGMLRMRLHGTQIMPEHLPGAIPTRRQARALRAAGPIQALPNRPLPILRATPVVSLPHARAPEPTDSSLTEVSDAYDPAGELPH